MTVHIIGGGTISHVRNHLALCAPAYGQTARYINSFYDDAELHLTKMAGGTDLETSEDIERLINRLIGYKDTKIIYFNPAIVDFDGAIEGMPSGKYEERMQSRAGAAMMHLSPARKIIGLIRKARKDIFVVGFKTTAGAAVDQQYAAALNMLKENSVNLVLANDVITRGNIIVAPEETRYHQTTDRKEVLRHLIEMTNARSRNTFTRSTVVDGETVPWGSPLIHDNLRAVVDHCIARGAYKPFRGVTAGHFAVRLGEGACLTSKRKTNYNTLSEDGLVRIDYDGIDKVVAHGFKPSVGGQSQRIVFDKHPDLDNIVHFHCPVRPNARDVFPIDRDQENRECGSHQCGAVVADNLPSSGDIRVVMLDNHGPNIMFSRHVPAEQVIEFIEANFDLSAKTGGLLAA